MIILHKVYGCLMKARSHKYYKRIKNGNGWRYFYTEAEYKKHVSKNSPDANLSKVKESVKNWKGGITDKEQNSVKKEQSNLKKEKDVDVKNSMYNGDYKPFEESVQKYKDKLHEMPSGKIKQFIEYLALSNSKKELERKEFIVSKNADKFEAKKQFNKMKSEQALSTLYRHALMLKANAKFDKKNKKWIMPKGANTFSLAVSQLQDIKNG